MYCVANPEGMWLRWTRFMGDLRATCNLESQLRTWRAHKLGTVELMAATRNQHRGDIENNLGSLSLDKHVIEVGDHDVDAADYADQGSGSTSAV